MANRAVAPNFESILDTPTDEVTRPKPLPIGTYDAVVMGMYETGVSSQKKTPFVQFAFKLIAAGPDVDEEELAAVLADKDGNPTPLSDKVFKNNSTKFYTTPDSTWRLNDAMEAMGVDLDGKTIRQALSETPNSSCKIVLVHTTSEDGEQTFSELKKILPAD